MPRWLCTGRSEPAAPRDDDDERVDPRAWQIAASSLMMGTALGVVLPIMPLFARELGVAPSELGVVIGAMGATRLLCNVPSAWAADRHGRVVSFAEKTERKYFPERFPFEPFGSAFEDHPEREERRKRRRPTSPPPAAPYRLHQEDVHPHSAPHSEAKQEL